MGTEVNEQLGSLWSSGRAILGCILHGFLVTLKQDRVLVALRINWLTLHPLVVLWYYRLLEYLHPRPCLGLVGRTSQ